MAPYAQTASTYNHIIERIWVELNHRVTYPVKRVITEMDNNGIINMDLPATKFCVSTVLSIVCKVGMNRMIAAWNSHPIPRHRIPNWLQEARNQTSAIHPAELPSLSAAVESYQRQGGSLTDPTVFGHDPLADSSALVQQRQQTWSERCGMIPEEILSQLVSGSVQHLQQAVIHFVEITTELTPWVDLCSIFPFFSLCSLPSEALLVLVCNLRVFPLVISKVATCGFFLL